MKKIILSIVTLFMMTSCASIFTGNKQLVKIRSNSNKVIRVYNFYGDMIAESKGKLEISLPKRTKGYWFKKYAEYTIKVGDETKKLYPFYNAAYIYGNPFTFGIGYLVDDLTGSGIDLVYDGEYADILNFK